MPIGEVVAATVPVAALRGLGTSPLVAWVRSASIPVPLTVTGEGVAFLGADVWHNDAGITGAGVKVAVIDGGFNGYASLLGDDLPGAVTTHNYCTSFTGTGHGTAVAEIVHEVAPGAELYLICIETLA
ncbi:MAG: peptidase S53, partial [Actinomycetota bacterium]|nr:peptidase S53 [Actinomycetota bacterium]